MTAHKFIGQPTASIEGADKVSGGAKYAFDAILPDMAWCKLLRSPYPHARIVSVDTLKAEALPGVLAVLTGDDVRGMRTGMVFHDDPLLAWDEVLYAGSRVAAVCAEDPEIAERAVQLIEVDYEELPALLTAAESTADGAPVIHPDFNDYPGVDKLQSPSNIYGDIRHAAGDIDAGFAEADVIVERTYSTSRAHQMYFEPHSCLVSVEADGSAKVWIASGTPGVNRDEMARVLGLPQEQVVVKFSLLGGSYGGKVDGTEASICYLLAQRTGRPVKYVATYVEELTAMHPRPPADIRIKAGVKRDGTLVAWDAELFFTSGAAAGYALVPSAGGYLVSNVAGPYRTPNIRIVSHQVYAHTIAAGYMRGPGPYQSTFARESHLDTIAEELGLSPVEIRHKNLIRESEELQVRGAWTLAEPGERPQAIRLGEALETAMSESGYEEPKPEGVGRGICIEASSEIGGDAHAAVNVHPDGRITVSQPIYGPGMDTYTTLAQVVAEELGVPLLDIEPEPWSTELGYTDAGIGGDRGARTVTLAGVRAVADLKQQLQSLAAELMGWEASGIDLVDGVLVEKASGERVPIADIVARRGESVSGQGDVDEPWDSEYASFAAHIAEVSVDRETGQVRLLRYTAIQETGQIINPIGFYGQVYGGISQSIGHGTMEEIALEDGRVTTPTLAEYKLPTVVDMPPMKVVVLDSDVGHGKFNVRGIGNKMISLPAPAIANAIADACGARIRDLPLTAEKVFRALRG